MTFENDSGFRGRPDLSCRAGFVRRLCRWRPEVGAETLLLATSLYFVLVCNGPFWRALLAGRPLDGAGSLGYPLAVAIALAALHFVAVAPFLTRWTTRPLLGLMILVAASSSHFTGQFGVYMDPGMLRNVLRTEVAEARELFSPGLFVHLALSAMLPLVLLQRVRVRRRSAGRALLLRAGAIALAIVAGGGALATVFKDLAAQMRNHKEIRYLVTPASAIYSLARVLSRDARAADRPRTPVGTDARLGTSWRTAAKPSLFVIVVGETARAADWGLNGRAVHDTTPELAQREVINFGEVASCGTNTEVSVPCLFSPQGRHDYDEDAIRGSESLLHVLHHAGLRVVWGDNQSGCKGVCEGLETWRPDPRTMPALCDGVRCLDAALLEGAQRLLGDARGNLVLVLHQLGNHGPAYYRRYPAEFRRFTPTCDSEDLARCSREEIVNAYDNALLYTDHVLASTIDWLKRVGPDYDTALLYVSDHGESLGENGFFLHGMPYAIAPAEQTRVPMMMWLSPTFAKRAGLDTACLREKAAQPASHDNVFHTVLGLLDVDTAVRNAALDLSAPCRS
jgi:lipid A ethanolaminephosphotransferase